MNLFDGVKMVQVTGTKTDGNGGFLVWEETYFIEDIFKDFKSRLLDELHVSAKMTPEEYEQWRKDMVRK